MKVTKKKGFNLKEVSHIKKSSKGILGELKNNETENKIEEKFQELSVLRLNSFIKTPKELITGATDKQKENYKRREKLQKYFSALVIRKIDKEIKIEEISKEEVVVGLEIYETDLRPFALNQETINGKLREAFNNILNSRTLTGEKLDLLAFDIFLIKHEKRLEKIKISLIKNKAQYEIRENEVKSIGKRNKFYEYYSDLKNMDTFEENIKDSFIVLYKKEEIENFNILLKNEETKKSDFFNKYREVLKSKISQISSDKFEEIKENIIEISDLGVLSKSQLIYKYHLETIVLDNDNIKLLFPHFIQIEMKYLFKNIFELKDKNIKNKEEKIARMLESYNSIIKLIQNKLKNKLYNYINTKGKIKEYYSNGEDKVIESYDLSEIRKEEAINRNLIGAISSAAFSFRNIVNPKEKNDILQKKIEEKTITPNVIDVFSLFYGDSFENRTSVERSELLNLIRNYVYELRNKILHFKSGNKIDGIFNDSINTSTNNPILDIFSKEYDENFFKLRIINQMNSANVFNYFTEKTLEKYLEKTSFSLTTKNVGFVPSFYKLFDKVNDYKIGLSLPFKVLETSNVEEEKERRDTQIYLLKHVYYGEFLEMFIKDDNGTFKNTVEEVIKLNSEAYLSKKTGFSKLDKFKEIEIESPKEYLAKIQSFYMLNQKEKDIEGDKDFFVEYIKKIFIKGFCNYIEENYKYLIKLELNKKIKSEIDQELVEVKKNYLKKNNEFEINKICNTAFTGIKVVDFPSFKKDANKLFLLFLKLLDTKELTNLRGNFEKIKTIDSGMLIEEGKILNLVTLVKDKKIDTNSKFKNLKLIEKFIDKELSDDDYIAIKELNDFSKNKNAVKGINETIYSDGTNLIENKALYNLKKHGMGQILEGIVEKSNYKVSSEDIKNYFIMKKDIDEKYKKQQTLHKEYIKNKKKDDFKKVNEYKKIIEELSRYNNLKNKVELNDINLIQSITLRILHRIAGYVSLWERDLKLKLTIIAEKGDPVDEIFKYKKEECLEYRMGQICQKYTQFLEKNQLLKESLPKNTILGKVLNKNIYLRNYISHFNYLPEPVFSLIQIFEKMRELLDYDRKLKNSILKSIIQIFEEYGFIVKFSISKDKKIEIEEIKGAEIRHLGGKVKIFNHSKEMCEVLKVALEYKKSNSETQNDN